MNVVFLIDVVTSVVTQGTSTVETLINRNQVYLLLFYANLAVLQIASGELSLIIDKA